MVETLLESDKIQVGDTDHSVMLMLQKVMKMGWNIKKMENGDTLWSELRKRDKHSKI